MIDQNCSDDAFNGVSQSANDGDDLTELSEVIF